MRTGEIIADASRSANKPFWPLRWRWPHGSTPSDLGSPALQVYSDLAYGAQGIQYFTYWTPQSDVWDFHNAPIGLDGKRTPVYDLVRKMTEEIGGSRECS